MTTRLVEDGLAPSIFFPGPCLLLSLGRALLEHHHGSCLEQSLSRPQSPALAEPPQNKSLPALPSPQHSGSATQGSSFQGQRDQGQLSSNLPLGSPSPNGIFSVLIVPISSLFLPLWVVAALGTVPHGPTQVPVPLLVS